MLQFEKNVCKSVSTSKNSENMGAGGETRQGVSLYFEFDANAELNGSACAVRRSEAELI